jgi:hypothetical protein
MAANTNPIYTRQGDCQGIQTSNLTASTTDGTGANVLSFYQADTTEGGYVDRVICKPIGSTAATVIRIFLHTANGSYTAGTTNTTSNMFLVAEATCAAVTSSTTAAQNDIVISIRMAIPPGYRLCVGHGTATGASTGYSTLAVGGKY